MTLAQIQTLIRHQVYSLSAKADQLWDEGAFELEDLEECILNATQINKRERDEQGESVDGYKYTIIARNDAGRLIYTAGKVIEDWQGRQYFIITAHGAT